MTDFPDAMRRVCVRAPLITPPLPPLFQVISISVCSSNAFLHARYIHVLKQMGAVICNITQMFRSNVWTLPFGGYVLLQLHVSANLSSQPFHNRSSRSSQTNGKQNIKENGRCAEIYCRKKGSTSSTCSIFALNFRSCVVAHKVYHFQIRYYSMTVQ